MATIRWAGDPEKDYPRIPYTFRITIEVLAHMRSIARFERRSINEQFLFMAEKFIDQFLQENPDFELGPEDADRLQAYYDKHSESTDTQPES